MHGYISKKKVINVNNGGDSTKGNDVRDGNTLLQSSFAEVDVKCASTGFPVNIISMCVVPVKLSHAKTKKEVFTLAMLDNCSQGSFFKQNMKDRLGISGRKTDVIIKTLNGERSMESEVVTGLRVSKEIRGEKMQWLNLPAVYTRDGLPADIDEAATCEKAKRWDHLKGIADNLPTESNMKIDLLIGANCARALEPVEVLPYQDKGPFAYKTLLGWCVVGPLTKTGISRSISSNGIAVRDAATSKVSRYHFRFTHEVQNVSAKKMLQEMYNADFIETIIGTSGNIEEMSYEDQKFLKLMDENVRKIGKHYQIPLPFRDKTKIFPNNREKRLGYLQRRFMKNSTFFEDYKRFIEDLLNKGYARKSKQGSPEGSFGISHTMGFIIPVSLAKYDWCSTVRLSIKEYL